MVKLNSLQAIRNAYIDSYGDFVSGYIGYIASNFIKEFPDFTTAINERSALAMAHMHSYLGKRSLIIMKNAGLNDAALPFRNTCDIGTNAGMVVVVSDDVQGRMSENKQDSRIYADLARTLLLEPKSPAEAYEMVREGFRLSEDHGLPILVRVTNALNNPLLVEDIERKELPIQKNEAQPDQSRWVLHPRTTIKTARMHDERYLRIKGYVEQSPFNFQMGSGKRKVVHSQALSRQQLQELESYDSVLSIGTYPLPGSLTRRYIEGSDRIDIIDDGEGFLEQKIRETISDIKIENLSQQILRSGNIRSKTDYSRLFDLIRQRNPDIVIGDFGFYTLAEGSPIEYALHYGGSLASAVGASLAGKENVYAIVGDGGFTHGISGLTEAIRKHANVNYVVIDNGGVSGKVPLDVDISELAKGHGVEYVGCVEYDSLDSRAFDSMEANKSPSVLIVKQ